MLEEGRFRSAVEIVEAEGVARSFVNRLPRLTSLAPDIVEAILEGRQPKAIQLEELTDAIPSEWEKQRKALCQAPPKRWSRGVSRQLRRFRNCGKRTHIVYLDRCNRTF